MNSISLHPVPPPLRVVYLRASPTQIPCDRWYARRSARWGRVVDGRARCDRSWAMFSQLQPQSHHSIPRPSFVLSFVSLSSYPRSSHCLVCTKTARAQRGCGQDPPGTKGARARGRDRVRRDTSLTPARRGRRRGRTFRSYRSRRRSTCARPILSRTAAA
jgi:hypothetical protein